MAVESKDYSVVVQRCTSSDGDKVLKVHLGCSGLVRDIFLMIIVCWEELDKGIVDSLKGFCEEEGISFNVTEEDRSILPGEMYLNMDTPSVEVIDDYDVEFICDDLKKMLHMFMSTCVLKEIVIKEGFRELCKYSDEVKIHFIKVEGDTAFYSANCSNNFLKRMVSDFGEDFLLNTEYERVYDLGDSDREIVCSVKYSGLTDYSDNEKFLATLLWRKEGNTKFKTQFL